jgi:hypothetical protein
MSGTECAYDTDVIRQAGPPASRTLYTPALESVCLQNWYARRTVFLILSGPSLSTLKDPGIIKLVPLYHRNRRLRVKEPDGRFRASQFFVRDMPSTLFYARSTRFDPDTFFTEPEINCSLRCGSSTTSASESCSCSARTSR